MNIEKQTLLRLLDNLNAKLSLILLVICLVGTQVVFAQQLKGNTWTETQKNGKGTIVFTYIEAPGFSYKDAKGNPNGLCVDIMNKFVDYVEKSRNVKLSVQYKGQTDDFKAFYNNVKTGSQGVFGLGNITITEARKKEVKFSPAYITNITVLLTNSQVPTLTSLGSLSASFNGMTAYTIKGTTNEKQLLDLKQNHFPGMKVVYLNSSPDVLQKLATDPTAFSNLDFTFYLDALKDKKAIKRHPVGDYDAEEFGFIMPMDSDWAPLMEEFLAGKNDFRNSAEYKQIMAKNLGNNAVNMLKKVRK